MPPTGPLRLEEEPGAWDREPAWPSRGPEPATTPSHGGSQPSHSTAHRDFRPICSCSHPPAQPHGEKGFRTMFPAGFPEPHPPCAASLPTTDLSVNYLYPSRQLLPAQGRQLCAGASPGPLEAGWLRADVQAGELGVRPLPLLLCDLGQVA